MHLPFMKEFCEMETKSIGQDLGDQFHEAIDQGLLAEIDKIHVITQRYVQIQVTVNLSSAFLAVLDHLFGN